MPEILDPGALDTGPDRQTRVVGGDGTSVLSYVLPAGLYQFIESVLVQVDASGAGGDVMPELAVATENGVVIATHRQTDEIPAGDEGSATFALRLAANARRRTPTLPYVQGAYSRFSPGAIAAVPTGTPTTVPFNFRFSISDTDVFTLTGSSGSGYPTTLQLNEAGVYLTFVSVTWAAGGFAARVSAVAEDSNGVFQEDTQPYQTVDPTGHGLTESGTLFRTASFNGVICRVTQKSGVNQTVDTATLKIVKVA